MIWLFLLSSSRDLHWLKKRNHLIVEFLWSRQRTNISSVSWSIPSHLFVAGENSNIIDRLTYLVTVIHTSTSYESVLFRRLGHTDAVLDSLDKGVWCYRDPNKRTKVRVFKFKIALVLIYSCVIWTLSRALLSRLNFFGTRTLCRPISYHWWDFVSNQRLYSETGTHAIPCLIQEGQLRLFGHVARFSELGSTYRILSS